MNSPLGHSQFSLEKQNPRDIIKKQNWESNNPLCPIIQFREDALNWVHTTEVLKKYYYFSGMGPLWRVMITKILYENEVRKKVYNDAAKKWYLH